MRPNEQSRDLAVSDGTKAFLNGAGLIIGLMMAMPPIMWVWLQWADYWFKR